MHPSIEVRGIRKTYAAVSNSEPLLALDDVSLRVERGEFVALLGPSGCGKSTLLHVVAGLIPAEGDLRVRGRAVTGPGLDRGVVFQDYALFPWRSVLQNVTFGLEMKGVPRRERQTLAREYIELVGLAGFEDRFPSQLSGGMKQRVAIARALAFDPEVLLMDEPFAALDAQTRESLRIELLRLWDKTKKTILFVTHSIDEAIFLARKVMVMTPRPGRIKEVVEIDLPQRTRGDVRSSSEFAFLRRRIRALLGQRADQAEATSVVM